MEEEFYSLYVRAKLAKKKVFQISLEDFEVQPCHNCSADPFTQDIRPIFRSYTPRTFIPIETRKLLKKMFAYSYVHAFQCTCGKAGNPGVPINYIPRCMCAIQALLFVPFDVEKERGKRIRECVGRVDVSREKVENGVKRGRRAL